MKAEKKTVKRKLYFVHGDKGGIGKSLLANTIADELLKNGMGNKLVIVDSDTRNPDVSRMFPDIAVRINLFTHDGWGNLFDLIEEKQDGDILVNLPAQIGGMIPGEKDSLRSLLDENNMQLLVLFPIDRMPDTVNLLTEAVGELIPLTRSHFYVVKNLFASPNDQFEEFDESAVAKILEKAKAAVIKMPELPHRVKKELSGSFHGEKKEQPLRVSEFLATKPPASIRLDLQKWAGTMALALAPVLAPIE